jgi:uncharacterized protein
MNTILRFGMLIGLLLTVYMAQAQNNDFDQDLVKLMAVNGSTETYNMVYNQLTAQLKQAKPNVSDSVWSNLKHEVFDVEVNELAKQMVPLYKKYFTQEDVKELISFYESPIGKKLTTKTPLLTQESMQISQTWGMNLMSKLYDWMAKKGY